ncbi:unnamed protein product [Cyclocybe aegerita]|uniref:RecQ-mediated genome instability protein 1 n=1 Tax=Cyclocybe aegerita TaxID=1973307 RepID=A0A8S0W8P1_CYCAE|nr:unnamed protein product [Cyclocybe aegerita]
MGTEATVVVLDRHEMGPPARVIQALSAQFPKPRVDNEWLEGCCQWVIEDQNISPTIAFADFMEAVKNQLILSDLRDSMLEGTGLDDHIGQYTGPLHGPPVLVQIVAITEIGASAFQLDQIRVAREERMEEGVGNEEGEEDGDVEVEGEGPMPKYPRGTLRFLLSDGVTKLDAVEYRPFPELSLGTTPLGFKLQLKGTRIQNGMAFLEPATVALMGGQQSELEAEQREDFKRGLYERLGRPYNLPQPATVDPPANQPQPPVRAPLRDISPPAVPAFPQHDDDVNIEPRRRIPTNSSLNPGSTSSSTENKQARPMAPLPSRVGRPSLESQNGEEDRRPSAAERATLVHAGTKKATNTISSYFNNGNTTASSSRALRSGQLGLTINKAVEELDFNFVPTTRQLMRTFSSPSPSPSPESKAAQDKKDASFDFDLLDEVDQENEPPPAQPSNYKGKGRANPLPSTSQSQAEPKAFVVDSDSDDYGMMDDGDIYEDAEFLENLNEVEQKALGRTSAAPPSSTFSVPRSGQASTGSSTLASSRTPSSPMRTGEVIEIDDSDEEIFADDKENEPVATRHVRRRMEENESIFRSRATFGSQAPALSQKTGRPIVLATSLSDVIDLSD